MLNIPRQNRIQKCRKEMKKKELIFTGFDKKIVPLMKKTAEFALKYEKVKKYNISL